MSDEKKKVVVKKAKKAKPAPVDQEPILDLEDAGIETTDVSEEVAEAVDTVEATLEVAEQATPEFAPAAVAETKVEVPQVPHTLVEAEEKAAKIEAKAAALDAPWIHLEVDGEIATAWIDQPGKSVNLLSNTMLDEIERVVHEVESNAEIKALVFASRKQGNFIAGADLTSMTQGGFDFEAAAAYGDRGRAIFQRVSELNVTTIACINGTCLGGGTELTLACDYRVASNDSKTKIGLPEVQLGILPAWGGVSRLPRMINLTDALDMMLTGKNLKPKKAQKIGLLHLIPPPELLMKTTYQLAKDALAGKVGYLKKTEPKSNLMDKALNNFSAGHKIVFQQARKTVMKQSKGFYPAPLKILETVQNSLHLPLTEAFKLEGEAFKHLLQRSETASLMNLFFINQELGRVPETEGIKGRKVKQMGVLGAGYMGAGIAQVSNSRGIDIRLKDVTYPALLSGLKNINGAYKKLVKRRRLTAKAVQDNMRRITTTTDYSGFQHADLVIEAVVERMDVKKTVFNELESHINENTILASNTSALSINEMAAATQRPDRFVGLHFFGPVQKMPLVEVILGEKTSPETLTTALDYVRKIGKTPVVIRKDKPGFVVNRILALYGNEAGLLLEEGADITTVDRLMTDFGMPMGIFEVIDLAGVDVAHHTANSVVELFESREGFKRSQVVQHLYDDQRLGQKSGRGFYLYAGKDPIPDHRYVENVVAKIGGDRREISNEEIRDRLVLSILNESALCLQEGLVANAGEIDMSMIMGTGFPPFRGGPLRLIDQQGVQFIVNQLEYYAETRGARFAPCDLLKEMAANNQKFYPLF